MRFHQLTLSWSRAVNCCTCCVRLGIYGLHILRVKHCVGVGRYGCEVHTFDHTVDATWIPPGYLNYHRIGLGQDGGVDDDMLSLPRIIDRLGHEDRVIDVFKIDCEGCEYGDAHRLLYYTSWTVTLTL